MNFPHLAPLLVLASGEYWRQRCITSRPTWPFGLVSIEQRRNMLEMFAYHFGWVLWCYCGEDLCYEKNWKKKNSYNSKYVFVLPTKKICLKYFVEVLFTLSIVCIRNTHIYYTYTYTQILKKYLFSPQTKHLNFLFVLQFWRDVYC